MTNIKVRGFDSDSAHQLDDHLSNSDDALRDDVEKTPFAQAEIAALRKEVGELHRRLHQIRDKTDGLGDRSASHGDRHPWLRIAATAAATFVLGRAVQRLRLGAAGAVAAPMIAAKLDSRIW